jgi:hypothetical protein
MEDLPHLGFPFDLARVAPVRDFFFDLGETRKEVDGRFEVAGWWVFEVCEGGLEFGVVFC